MAPNLYPSGNVANIFNNWLHGIGYKYRIIYFLERSGRCNMIAMAMLCRNYMVANGKNSYPQFACHLPMYLFDPFVVLSATF
jgi:hypothetical protein